MTPPPKPSEPLPWNAAIGRLDILDEGGSCSATLVKPNIIVTAAHCVYHKKKLSDAGKMLFTPYVGFKTKLPPVRVDAILKTGGMVDSESDDFGRTREDWAILKLSENIDYLKPIPLTPYSLSELKTRLNNAASIAYVGYGTYGVTAGWMQHIRENCKISEIAEVAKDIGPDSLITDCQVIKGDSGGPMLLTLANGEHQLIGVLSGFWRSRSQSLALSFGPLATNFGSFIASIQKQP